MPANLDGWDGFPAARDRLYASMKATGANLVTLTGDTHSAWANTLMDSNGEQRGVEFGCSSVTSPGSGHYMKDINDLGEQFSAANPEVDWNDHSGSGWTLVTLMRDTAQADYRTVSDVTAETYSVTETASFTTTRNGDAMTPLSRKA